MKDKTIKYALVVVTGLLCLSILKPAATKPIVPIEPSQPVMVVDNATLYVLVNNKIYVYAWNGPATKKLVPLTGKLELLQTLDSGISKPERSQDK